MIISKRAIVLGGIVCIFFFAFLNRIHVIQKSEMVGAYAHSLYNDDTQYVITYVYKGDLYKKVVENNISLENDTQYRLLIREENPERFAVFNFMGFWFVALIVSCVATMVWLLFAQVFFEKVVNFKFSFGKEKKDEIEDE